MGIVERHRLWSPVQLLLVSASPIPNLATVFCPSLRPERVVLAVTPPMKEKAQHLRQVFVQAGIAVEIRDLPEKLHMAELETCFQHIYQDHPQILLNATGGLKLHALAAVQLANKYKQPVVYIEKSCWLLELGGTQDAAERLSPQYSLRDLFLAFGLEMREAHQHAPQAQECLGLLHVPLALRRYFTVLLQSIRNSKANVGRVDATDYFFKDSDFSTHKHSHGLRQLRKALCDMGIVCEQNGGLFAIDKELSQYLAGTWFEEAMFALCDAERKAWGLTDVVWNAKLYKPGQQSVAHELDVVALRDGELFVLECKTFADPSKETKKVIDGLLALRDTLGTQTHEAYASANGLRSDEEALLRIADRKIHLITDSSSQHTLRQALNTWFTK